MAKPPEPPLCERCGQPAYNINNRTEYTGVHTSVEQCFSEMGKRILALEQTVRILRGG